MATKTHKAVVTASIRGALEILEVPTVAPGAGEVLVRVEWTASTPLDLHQNDGGLLVTHPQVLGDGTSGTVVEVGDGVKKLQVGDKVFGFTWREQKEKSHQEYVTVPEYLLGKIPQGFTPQEAVTLPNNVVSSFHALTKDLSIPLPWPILPSTPKPEHSNSPILIWGGSSSVGQYALQILRHWGYSNLITTSSPSHNTLLKSLGATQVFDYRSPDCIPSILDSVSSSGGLKFVLDCIGSQDGSLTPISKLVGKGARVAVLLPVIVRDGSETVEPIYALDAKEAVEWADGVDVRGVRTHFYLENEVFKERLQPEIMPTLLAEGIIKPNKYRVVEGTTLLERAQAALDALRRKEVSGERLVWKVAE
ncbi:uncharacterized protein BP5553_03188 [Venustampulla echinocandica]|uniref:Enoyl reductase (ER) domain-containing protein n=1 Tax=Venustampulla echinocandica TaxID=2656787 RepID=A0A370TTM6_9HELO|nr:uncharacterized protein BP5553_03188 [Venustampulla echinocandica]RDL38848.1 hypothetical protein BP5553_03188 [Venustampulla echinocandica]